MLWTAGTFILGTLLCYALEVPTGNTPKAVKGSRYEQGSKNSLNVITPVAVSGTRNWIDPRIARRRWILHAAASFFYLATLSSTYLLIYVSDLDVLSLSPEYISAVAAGSLFILFQWGAFAIWHRKLNFIPSMGIINFVWTLICGAALALVYAFGYLVEQTNASSNVGQELLLASMSKIVDGSLTLGGVLATAMSILWAGQVWRNAQSTARSNEYKITTVVASKMVIAYFVIITAFGLWVGVPLVSKLAFASVHSH